MNKLIKISLILLCCFGYIVKLAAQTDTIRYVDPVAGNYRNDGRSWRNAKNSLQDAINDLNTYLTEYNLHSGRVYVVAGTYTPSESTEQQGGGMLSTSFKIYGGVSIYGGFNPDIDLREQRPEDRIMSNGKTWQENQDAIQSVGTSSDAVEPWQFMHRTYLTGNHSAVATTFTFDNSRGRYDMVYPGNSYHVVWFATNGKVEDNDNPEHYKALEKNAWIDGVTIQEGFASNRTTSTRSHTSYGGGAYMVGKSGLRNCIVERCAATVRGGGVYMDGGGKVESCLIHTCQATGVGIVQGYGGGICMDYDGAVEHCYITQCSSRIGAGLAICHVPGEYPQAVTEIANISPYSPYAMATLITNNTSTAEGGGVYLDEGGTINHCTVVRNNCIGPNVMYYGRRHGRSGGVYILDKGMIYNSVMWGNGCTANNNMQFAVHVNQTDSATIDIYHSALENHDITDWTGVRKDVVFSIEHQNYPVGGQMGSYPCFTAPTTTMGIQANENGELPATIPSPSIWHPQPISALAMRGVQITDAVQGASGWALHAHTRSDLLGNTFEPVSSLGALVRENEKAQYALIETQSKEKDGTNIPTLFVDPNRQDTALMEGFVGASWNKPLENLGDALQYFKQYVVENGADVYYRMPDINPDGTEKGTFTNYPYVQILVKEGVLTTAGPGNYLGLELRTASIRMASNMRLYGAYPATNRGTDTQNRNPRSITTRISANITGGNDDLAFQNNAAHVLTFVNAQNAVVDGFRLYNANAHHLETTYSVEAGGGVLINNLTTPQAQRRDMVGNQLRNCVIANCYAPKGVAIYVNGEHKKADGTMSRAELYVVNCVMRNCTADYQIEDSESSVNHGIVTANGNAHILLNHCTIVNNVGYAIKTDNKATTDDSDLGIEGTIEVNNTCVFANGNRQRDDRVNILHPLTVLETNPGHITGSYNMFDFDATLPTGLQAENHNSCIFTRTDRNDKNYPVFVNPSRNVGHSPDDDKPLYGGVVSYMPMNTNPVVNAASPESVNGTDRSDIELRNYGGAADIGAVENTNLPKAGTVLYVTPEGRGKRDGSSWANAIAGNTVYQVAGLGETYYKTVNGEQVDNNIVYADDAFVPTTDSRYRGGYSIVSGTSYKHVLISAEVTKTINQEQWSGTMDDDGNIELGSSTVTTNASPQTETLQLENTTQTNGEVDFSATFPYGERSGFSKDFWETNQYDKSHNSDISKIHITNEREEAYVGGLQYAVEKAAYLNQEKDNPDDYVQVWVGNGTYDDYKSFIMRDKVSVYGGFPASTISVPGMAERRALVTEYTPLPDVYSSLKNQESNYQTVLQISEKSPIKEDYQFDKDAILGEDLEVEQHKVYKKTSSGKAYELTELLPLTVTRRAQYISNSTFDNNTDGWTCEAETLKDKGLRNQTQTVSGVSMTNTIQLWSGNSRTDLKNGAIWTAVTGLKAGTYTLQADAYTTGDEGGTYLMIQEVEGNSYDASLTKESDSQALTRITPKDKINHFSVTYTKQSATSTLIVGIRVFEGYSTGWVNADNFELRRTDVKDIETATINVNMIEDGDFELNPVSGRWLGNGGTLWNTANYDGNHIAYFSNANFDRYQELQGLPNGTYLVTCRGFYRAGASGSTSLKQNVLLYAIPDGGQEVSTPLPSIHSYTSKTTSENEFTAVTTNGTTYYVPNSQQTAAKVFKTDPGAYCAELLVTVTNHKLRLGVKNANRIQNDWTCIDDLKIFRVVSQTEGTESEEEYVTESNTSTPKSTVVVRKPVLAMPDVCLPSYSPNDVTGGDNVSNTDRMEKRREGNYTPKKDSGYKLYTDVLWDGFVLRNGYYYNYRSNRDGGAGVRLFEGGTLKNCVVTNNIFCANGRSRGGGIYCDGLTANVISCFVIHNVATPVSGVNNLYGGGVYMIVGTCYNTLIANNVIKGDNNDISGAGIFIEDATFYNNTIAYNKCLKKDGTVETHDDRPGGIMHWSASTGDSKLSVFNTLVYKNSGRAIQSKNFNGLRPFLNCYVQSDLDLHNNAKVKITSENNNILLIGSDAETPFASAEAEEKNDFRLRSGSSCINTGLSEPNGVTLPSTDVAFADRVQDCQVDIGAYEHDGSYEITPQLDTLLYTLPDGTTEERIYARYYVQANNTMQGLASGDSPGNAACEMKFQQVLDAAGRWKNEHENHWVVVRMTGDEAETDYATFRPQRSTLAIGNVDNLTDYSIIVPHGVTLEGGWNEDFTLRDPLRYKTVLSGYAENRETGSTDAQVYHVVTFTNDLYTTNQKPFIDENNQYVYNQLARLTENRDRAVLDGLFIENGYANGPDEQNRRGGAAVITSYAHINNCVIRQNRSTAYGGAVYMQPGALLTGSIFTADTSAIGGAVYVEPLDLLRQHTSAESYSRIYCCTFVGNHATTRAGGLWFQNNMMASSSIFWKNSSNDLNNVIISNGEESNYYPFNYCGVESRKLDGVNNIELSPTASEGTRWDSTNFYENSAIRNIKYYPISMSSSLARSGMIYSTYNELLSMFPTMTARDITGVSRTEEVQDTVWISNEQTYVKKRNDFIEIGARAINLNFDVQVEDTLIMKRLFVVKSEELNSDVALRLQSNSGTTRQDLLYKQMGSSFANPFHRLGDALEYIIKVRTDNELYRDTVFEVFLSGGTYQPYHDSRGRISEVRASTFVIPEGVSIIGGLAPQVMEEDNRLAYYCQRGYESLTNQPDIEVAGVRLLSCPTDTIRLRREMNDINMNNIIEPWEFREQTILTGSTTAAQENTNIYHIITCVADPKYVGHLPSHYTDDKRQHTVQESDDEEIISSRARRTIMLDGLFFMNGHANDIDLIDEQKVIRQKTYFRGGAILVDGNLDNLDVNDHTTPTILDKAKHNIPLLIANCQFQNNMAANGGAIWTNGSLRVYGSSFIQNYSRGPNSALDQKYIPWSAGGAIAGNGYIEVVNSLFANNEAQRGNMSIDAEQVTEQIVDADRRQGYGGAIAASSDATVHAINCNFVRNRAQAYPAIFNFLSNRHYSPLRDEDDMQYINHEKHFAVNSVFWGNKADLPPDDDYHYPQEIMNIGYLPEDRDLDDPASVERMKENEALYFCAYEEGTGPVATRNIDDRDFRKTPVPFFGIGNSNNADSTVLAHMIDSLGGFNHNIILSSNNTASDGPNFIQPSTEAGINGYMQNADWLVSKLNSLTDRGWGSLHQTVSRTVDYYEYYNGTSRERFDNVSDIPDSIRTSVYAVYKGAATVEFTKDDDGLLQGNGLYNRYADFIKDLYKLTLMPIGPEKYISYSRNDSEGRLDMTRISSNPLLTTGSTEVFIDLGMYEYQYIQLNTTGHEVDTVWVTSKNEAQDADGSTWEKATSNIQVAIETLLRSRNNKDKYICFIGGDSAIYSPQYITNNHLSFNIFVHGSKDDGMSNEELSKYIYLPSGANPEEEFGIRSLNFIGGYSPESSEVERNPEAYPVVLQMQPLSTTASNSEMAHLFYITDVQQKRSRVNYIGQFDEYADEVIPIRFDGLTFINPYGEQSREGSGGGADIFYGNQLSHIKSEDNINDDLTYDIPLDAPSSGLPKLTITNCKFIGAGHTVHDPSHPTASPSAVRIMHGGHNTLIANSLFHSGKGNPIEASSATTRNKALDQDSVAQNPVTVINCTFALNGGHLKLADEGSSLLNSIIWRDDQNNGEQEQYELGNTDSQHFAYNAITGLQEEGQHNNTLSDENNNVLIGPNFENPAITATGMDDILQRSFRLNPSKMTMNCADTTIYHNIMNQSAKTDFDLAKKNRLTGQGLERGAYECVARLQRVLYADPRNIINEEADGSTWNKAFVGVDAAQKAIEVASIYSSLNHRQSYVFVRNTAESPSSPITLRNGVSVYGSIEHNFTDEAFLDEQGDCDNDEVSRYVNLVRSTKKGIAGTTGTRVEQVIALPKSADGDPTLMRLIDGFEISNGTQTITHSPVLIDADSVVLRNCLVHNNRINADVPVVDLRGGLMYNSLVYGNTYLDDQHHTRVRVGNNALVLNCTLVTDHHGSITVDATADNSVVNTITLNIMDSTLSRTGAESAFRGCNTMNGMFAPYMQPHTPYQLDPSFTGNIPLHYQLHERSAAIDAGLTQEEVVAANPNFSKYFTPHLLGNAEKGHLLAACNFSHDRDMLGNPRILGNGIDLGCYETWLINGVLTATTRTDTLYDKNFGGNFYPHPNSVVYVGQNSTLLLDDTDDDGYQTIHFPDEKPIQPCYLLLCSGASVYGQGNTLLSDYIAIEQTTVNQRYQLLSLPFDMNFNNLHQVSYDPATDILKGIAYRTQATPYQYNAEMRAAHDYNISADSPCWQVVTNDTLKANTGLLVDIWEPTEDPMIIRYTGWQSELGKYIYEEHGEDKIVELLQNDLRPRDGSAHFTKAEDMGWNFVGMPYIVADYYTGIGDNGHYQMDIPHIIYAPTADKVFAEADELAAVESWQDGAALHLGKAFFTQTATTAAKEELHFRLPEYRPDEVTTVPYRLTMTDSKGKGDYLQVRPTDNSATTQLSYRQGRDAVKWTLHADLPSIALLTADGLTPLALSMDAPRNIAMPLVLTTDNDTYTFAIDDPDSYTDAQHIWLIDKQNDTQTDLLQSSAIVSCTKSDHNSSRFQLLIGNLPQKTSAPARVYCYGHSLHIDGLSAGDNVNILSSAGVMIEQFDATSNNATTTLPTDGLYIVNINGKTEKIIATPL